nr:hypothetical protein [Chlorobium ferrooxidans]
MMELIPIFPKENPRLFAVKYDGESADEYHRIFDLWSDVEYLERFFQDNPEDLSKGYYRYQSVDAAVEKTINDAESLEDYLLYLAARSFRDPFSLQTLFQPLNSHETHLVSMQKSKAKYKKSPWLRLYAVRIASDLFVITGGAIKLTKLMEEREHTQQELCKLDLVKNFLFDQGLLDKDDFEYLKT